MIYRFIDNKGTFIVQNPQRFSLYFPLTNQDGTLLSSISPNLAGDIKRDNEHFLTPPASIEDIRSNLLCRREFFIKTSRGIIRSSYAARDTLEAGFLYHKMIKKAGPLAIEILNFIPFDIAVEVMWIKVINQGKKEEKITPTSFIPLYGRAERNLRDHRHVSSLLNRIRLDKHGILLKPTMSFDEAGHRVNGMAFFVMGYEGQGIPPLGQFPTLDYFQGEGDMIFPEAIEGDIAAQVKMRAEFDGKEACAAFRFGDRRLKPGGEADYFLIMGIEREAGSIKSIFSRLNSPRKISKSFQETKQYWQGYLAQPDFDFKDNDFNNWLLWVKFQPALRKLFGCSFLPHFDYGKGGRGWRDLWQDALTLLLSEPDKARGLITHNFKGVRIDGSNATVITKNGDFITDRNRITRVWMDHGIWPYLTLRFYIHKTGDLGILLKDTTYFQDHRFKRAKEIDYNFPYGDCLLRSKSNQIYRGNILEHLLVENLVQFFNVGVHNTIRLENADWNDGLDMAADRGESVAFSFMYAYNLRDLADLLEELKKRTEYVYILKDILILLDRLSRPAYYNNFKAKHAILEEYLERVKIISAEKIKVKVADIIFDLREKVDHLYSWLGTKEWLGSGFFNGYYDNKSRRLEGKCKMGLRMMLPTQVFAIMSEVATQEQAILTFKSIKRYLYDRKHGGFRLNTDFKFLHQDLGRAFGFS